MRWADRAECHLVLTTSGTGFAPSDLTPEATEAVIERSAPGIAEAMRAASAEHTRYWPLSRASAGIRGAPLIVNFPGNPKAIAETASALLPLPRPRDLTAAWRPRRAPVMGATDLTPEAACQLVLVEVVPTPAEPVPPAKCLGRVTVAEVSSAVTLYRSSTTRRWMATRSAPPTPRGVTVASRCGWSARHAPVIQQRLRLARGRPFGYRPGRWFRRAPTRCSQLRRPGRKTAPSCPSGRSPPASTSAALARTSIRGSSPTTPPPSARHSPGLSTKTSSSLPVVSVGRHDHVKDVLAKLGVQERFWRVAMRPGGPTWFGVLPGKSHRRPTLVFGLPGNPVSAMVTFHLFARPALRAMLSLPPLASRARAVLAAPYAKKPGKVHYARCRLETTKAGWRAHLTRSNQGSHVLTSMLGADALATMPADRDEVAAGELVEVELLH